MKKKAAGLYLTLVLFLGFMVIAPISGAQNQDLPSSPGSWSIVASYTIPGKASGLAWDGTYIYFGIYGSNGSNVHRFDPSNGSNTLQCVGPFDDAYGLTYKGPNLVTIKQPSSSAQPALGLEFTLSGSQVSTITLPNHYMSGIAHDNGSYWVCTYYPDPGTVYHVNSSGTVLSQFVPPANQPWDICLQGSDLWIADYNANMLYKVTSTGTVIESHASQILKPSGVVYDGTYLWYCAGELGGNSTLYKVDLLGSGTPVITVPATTYNYGTVTVGTSPTWNCQVQNTGTANLVINSVGIMTGQPVTSAFSTPATVTPGNSVNIPFTYQPLAPGSLNTQAFINSNDPIHPTITLTLTGNAVIAGPNISITDTLHDWGDRRMGAYSRWYLPVTNDGNSVLTISGLTFSSPHYSIDASVVLPLSVQPLQTVNLGIWFHPTEGIAYPATLAIASNDPLQNPFIVTLEGTGVDTVYPMGTPLWNYVITGSFDNSPKAIIPIQDITGDGVDDVIVTSEDNNIRCLNGNSSGVADVMWTTDIYSGNIYNQNSLTTIDDIDNDGYRDVIVGTTGGDRSIRALSGKTGIPIWKHDTHEYGGGGWLYQVDARIDYNNDGFPDVLACTGDDGNDTGPRRVYCLNGYTGLSIWETPTGAAVFSVIGVEDFTGDGLEDVIAGATNPPETQSRVYGINGSNGAIVWTSYPSGSSTWALMQIDDCTGDGIKDVASGDYDGKVYFHNAVTGSQVKITTVQNNALILRFEDMGDVNKDGHPDILVAHSGAKGVMINGYNAEILWQEPLADKSWNVTNMGDINWDGTNDAAIGTLYVNNGTYFMDGATGEILQTTISNTAIDALHSIPDIVGDNTRELVAGGRNGLLVCLSGGYDTTTTSVPGDRDPLASGTFVYPNPCDDVLHVSVNLKNSAVVTVSVSDITGRSISLIEKTIRGSGVQTFTLNRDQLTGNKELTGIYLISVKSGDDIANFKVIFR